MPDSWCGEYVLYVSETERGIERATGVSANSLQKKWWSIAIMITFVFVIQKPRNDSDERKTYSLTTWTVVCEDDGEPRKEMSTSSTPAVEASAAALDCHREPCALEVLFESLLHSSQPSPSLSGGRLRSSLIIFVPWSLHACCPTLRGRLAETETRDTEHDRGPFAAFVSADLRYEKLSLIEHDKATDPVASSIPQHRCSQILIKRNHRTLHDHQCISKATPVSRGGC